MSLFPISKFNLQLNEPIREARCGTCKLGDYCLSPKMLPSGEGKKGILVVAEAPGEQEDKTNTQLVGKAGQLFRSELRALGIDLDRDCRKTNAVCCRPPSNRTPSNIEIDCCRSNVLKEIEAFKPKLILVLGNSAISSVITHKTDVGEASASLWRGWSIPDQDYKSWLCPTFHPSYIARNTTDDVALLVFKQDLQNALSYLNKPVPDYNYKDSVYCLYDINDIKQALEEASYHTDLVALDYETDGLKPFRSGHKIYSMAVAFRNGESGQIQSYAFRITSELRRPIIKFLLSSCQKVIANISFEETWSRVIFNCPISNVVFDPILGAHVIDNRTGITSVKFQTYVNFGVSDYNSHIAPYLEAPSRARKVEGSHAFNQISKIDTDDLLLYNGLDSLYELILAEKQMAQLDLVDIPF